MNTRKTNNQRTTKPKHIVALANPKRGGRSKIQDCATVVQLPDCNSVKTVPPCPSCKEDCKWACQSLCKFGCKPSEKAPPPPKIGNAEMKKGRARRKK